MYTLSRPARMGCQVALESGMRCEERRGSEDRMPFGDAKYAVGKVVQELKKSRINRPCKRLKRSYSTVVIWPLCDSNREDNGRVPPVIHRRATVPARCPPDSRERPITLEANGRSTHDYRTEQDRTEQDQRTPYRRRRL